MNEVSVFRLYVLRAMYLFIVVGLGVYLWPGVLNPRKHWELMEGMASCMLAAFSLLCILGLRFPLQMLPVLLWEVVWKTLWLMLVPLPQWMGRPCRRFDQALDLCHIHGRARLHRHSLALCICALRESARRSLAVTSRIEREYKFIRYVPFATRTARCDVPFGALWPQNDQQHKRRIMCPAT